MRIYDFGESNGRYFLVMEYIEGKTIGTMITDQVQFLSMTAVQAGTASRDGARARSP